MSFKLTPEILRRTLDYNKQTGLFTWKIEPYHHSCKFKIGDQAGHKAGKGYISVKLFGQSYAAHRLAYFYVLGFWPEDQIDHKDQNKSNNSWYNLRECSNKINHHNKPKQSNNKSGVTGVLWKERINKWIAYITIEGKKTHLGSFTSKEEAIKVRLTAEKEHGYYCNHGKKLISESSEELYYAF